MSAHTPGPWVVTDNPGHSCCFECGIEATTDGGEHICDTNVANARLIAASPLMLAALKRVADGHLGCGECSTAEPCFVCAAITAAEGKS